MKLVYVGDPMCSWCYGFGKELAQLLARHPGLEFEIVLGGLRAGGTEVLDDAAKQFRLQHWARVEAASGLPFNREAFAARQGFVYDTEPVCRAALRRAPTCWRCSAPSSTLSTQKAATRRTARSWQQSAPPSCSARAMTSAMPASSTPGARRPRLLKRTPTLPARASLA